MGTDPAPPPDPEELTAAVSPVSAEIPPATRPGPVHLSVADLDRSIAYYKDTIGLVLRERHAGRARLGTVERDLVILEEQPGARPARGYCGLYHFALLVPDRVDLARWLAHAARERLQLTGLSDHFVSEAIYLTDPDGHGIEIYWDRPRPTWEGRVAERMTTLPLDIDNLLAELPDPAREPFERLADGTTMGHVHLRVAEIGPTVAFYRDVLGLGLMAAIGSQAAFLSAGGYHHHIGANTWESAATAQPPEHAARLLAATLLVPTRADRDRLAAEVAATGQEPLPVRDGVLVRDPSQDGVLGRDPSRVGVLEHDPVRDGMLVRDPSGNPIVLVAC